jgi:hypothetical protein
MKKVSKKVVEDSGEDSENEENPKPKKRGRPSKGVDSKPAFKWGRDAVELLLTLNLITYKQRFEDSHEQKDKMKVWNLIVLDFNLAFDTNYPQRTLYKKFLSLRKLHCDYTADMKATGNGERMEEPEHWDVLNSCFKGRKGQQQADLGQSETFTEVDDGGEGWTARDDPESGDERSGDEKTLVSSRATTPASKRGSRPVIKTEEKVAPMVALGQLMKEGMVSIANAGMRDGSGGISKDELKGLFDTQNKIQQAIADRQIESTTLLLTSLKSFFDKQ